MEDLLKHVSRSFYLTLRILPYSVRSQMSLAYLLARATDTVADTQLVSIQRRLEAILHIRKSIQDVCEGHKAVLPDFGDFARAQRGIAQQGTPAERALLGSLEMLFDALSGFAADDRIRIRDVLNIITHGQETDLIRFGTASADQISALGTDAELDAYIYEVAGCVGEFWTQMCRTHVFPADPLDDHVLYADAIRFGKGLQLVNILRDLPVDLRQGRCYLPEEQLLKCGLKAQDLLDPGAAGLFRPLSDHYLKKAEDHLLAGWRYTRALPSRCVRIRLACSWPILIGVRTVELLRAGNVLDGRHRLKVSRSEVRRLMLRSIILYPYRTAWNHLVETVQDGGSN
jgi:farnesyl-diphosphate farnesyltransferase